MGWADQVYKDIVPTNVRMFVRGLSGEKSQIDETYFKPEELEVMKDLITRMNENYQVDTQMGIEREPAVTYDDYPLETMNLATGAKEGEAWWTKGINPSLWDAMTKPDMKVLTSMGRFSWNVDDKGNIIATDRYDFNMPMGPKDRANVDLRQAKDGRIESLYGTARAIGGAFLPADGDSGFDIRVNLGNPYKWGSNVDKATGTSDAEMTDDDGQIQIGSYAAKIKELFGLK